MTTQEKLMNRAEALGYSMAPAASWDIASAALAGEGRPRWALTRHGAQSSSDVKRFTSLAYLADELDRLENKQA